MLSNLHFLPGMGKLLELSMLQIPCCNTCAMVSAPVLHTHKHSSNSSTFISHWASVKESSAALSTPGTQVTSYQKRQSFLMFYAGSLPWLTEKDLVNQTQVSSLDFPTRTLRQLPEALMEHCKPALTCMCRSPRCLYFSL